ncbi:MAG: hypothetical protein CM15mP127_14320 [Gammaproteobacteria bacterium]|nr:MAG: hypothetical protein CM15mP127_14320 [Gammaproteobacteria bacterium]
MDSRWCSTNYYSYDRGSGNIVDPNDPNSFDVDPISGDTLPSGTVLASNGYLFDPVGSDGVPASGDEWGAATGYFFTYQFMEAGALFPGVLNAALGAGAGLQDALTAAADTVAEIFWGPSFCGSRSRRW